MADIFDAAGIVAVPNSQAGPTVSSNDMAGLYALISQKANEVQGLIASTKQAVYRSTSGQDIVVSAVKGVQHEVKYRFRITTDTNNTGTVNVPLLQGLYSKGTQCQTACPGSSGSTNAFNVYLNGKDDCALQHFLDFRSHICSSGEGFLVTSAVLVDKANPNTPNLDLVLTHQTFNLTGSQGLQKIYTQDSLNAMQYEKNVRPFVIDQKASRWDKFTSLVIESLPAGADYELIVTVVGVD